MAAIFAWTQAGRYDYARLNSLHLRKVSVWLAASTAIQCIHFIEESQTGFPESLAALFSIPSMPDNFFLWFNLAWLLAWSASVFGVLRGFRLALFAAWFLAIAGIANGFLHPLLAVLAGTYFPGLYSAPVVGLMCWRLSVHLREMRTG